MLFGEFAKYLQKLEKTSSRLAITAILKELFKKTPKDEIKEAVYLSLGVLAPNYEGVILNLAEKMMERVLSVAYKVPLIQIEKIYKRNGDLGITAEKLSRTQELKNSRTPTVKQVYERLVIIAKENGERSQERKLTKMIDLLQCLDSLSVRYVTRIPVGKLRLGFSEKTILDALGCGDTAYNIRPDIGYIAEQAVSRKLYAVSPKVGIPVVPMLAQRLNSPSEMIKKMGEVAVEPKFDGLRIFIHYKKDYLRIFTRNMNSLDPAIFPELKNLEKYVKADQIILDTEAVGLDEKRERFVDFQKTITRRRKHEVQKTELEVPLQFQVFDCVLVDSKSLIDKPYTERRQVLKKQIVSGNLLRVDESILTKDPEVIKSLHQKYLKMGLEGVVVKRANGKYVSGRTGWNWVKMKEVEGKSGRLADTIDAVVMGYSPGKGKRAGFGVGQFLVGIRDGESFLTLTKVGTGITDELFKKINKELKKLGTKEKPKEYSVHKDLIPDNWVIPSMVVEISADNITKSPKHTSGFALRFPRLIKIRYDKTPKEATTLKELKEIGN